MIIVAVLCFIYIGLYMELEQEKYMQLRKCKASCSYVVVSFTAASMQPGG